MDGLNIPGLISATHKVTVFVIRAHNAEKACKPFVEIRDAVERDLKVAKYTLADLEDEVHLRDAQKAWLKSVFAAAKDAIAAFDKPLSHAQGGPEGVKASFFNKSKFVLFYADEVQMRQKSLSTAHASLLQAISLIHQVALQSGILYDTKPTEPYQLSTNQFQMYEMYQTDLTDLDSAELGGSGEGQDFELS